MEILSVGAPKIIFRQILGEIIFGDELIPGPFPGLVPGFRDLPDWFRDLPGNIIQNPDII
jgi:hypothetical protein